VFTRLLVGLDGSPGADAEKPLGAATIPVIIHQ
jgi:hypothetical protein